MYVVGVKALKNQLSEYLRRVRAGETFLVTDRDHVVAELRPANETQRTLSTDELVLADLIRKGVITPASKRLSGPPSRLPIATHEMLMAELDEDRANR